jgi:hypothetical protein
MDESTVRMNGSSIHQEGEGNRRWKGLGGLWELGTIVGSGVVGGGERSDRFVEIFGFLGLSIFINWVIE